MNQKPAPPRPAPTTFYVTVETPGLLRTLCRGLSRDSKMTKNSTSSENQFGGLSRQAHACYIRLLKGYVTKCGPWPCHRPLVLTRSHKHTYLYIYILFIFINLYLGIYTYMEAPFADMWGEQTWRYGTCPHGGFRTYPRRVVWLNAILQGLLFRSIKVSTMTASIPLKST